MRYLLLICLSTATILASALSFALQTQIPTSFEKAKRLAKGLYLELLPLKSFYCGCDIVVEQKRWSVDWQSCGYQVRKQQKRAARIEWEHLVSAWELGHQRQCWQQGGRKLCRKSDPVFRLMEADLHNLVPAIGEVNGDRSNYRFSPLAGRASQYGQCDMQVDFKARKASPPEASRGQIARTYWYMRDQYGLQISPAQQQLFEAWDRQFPPLPSECTRELAIAAKQGTRNRYVQSRCGQPQNLAAGERTSESL
ncbi:endonuclease [Paraferrimonas sedimenticola]|uniref:Deoxyribonuclease n=1 Tax=Paraferrimonas sedimenticola TaxID=375674 RepID=A0AA37W0V1_9GAMM|nr:endonuclease [Paraferrimonas sedimenticola]GLP95577.1 deoxyribonuclease [Paraferrimonas sedimenticola]